MSVKADVIVVLGCVVRPHGEPSRAMRCRLVLAVDAFKRGVAKRVLVSGGRNHDGYVEADVMRNHLVAAGIAPDAILVEPRSLSTIENAYYSAQMLKRHGLSRAMIATQQWHMRRAVRDFRHFGIDAIAPPAVWHDEPPVALKTFLSERVCYCLDLLAARTMG